MCPGAKLTQSPGIPLSKVILNEKAKQIVSENNSQTSSTVLNSIVETVDPLNMTIQSDKVLDDYESDLVSQDESNEIDTDNCARVLKELKPLRNAVRNAIIKFEKMKEFIVSEDGITETLFRPDVFLWRGKMI